MLQLRPYQLEAVDRVREAYRAGRRRVLVSLPTGTGKTVVFASFPHALRMRRRLLVLAHREELLVQARDKFRLVDPDLRVEIERGADRASADAAVVIASVPTLARAHGRRLARLRPEEFSIVVVDEAHHAVAPTYRRVFDHFGLMEPSTQRFLIGFTATPRRGDRQGLGEVFEEVCYARDLRDMIGEGYLAPIAGWRVDSDVSLDGVRIRHGDFVESQLARVINTPARNELLLRSYRALADGRRAIVFCVDVAHAHATRQVFAQAGVRAAAVWGAMPADDRRASLARFSSGELDVLTNCNLLTEGFDEPRVDCIIMARPTRSKLLYAQMVGRGTRLHPDKTDLLVVDISDNSRTHQLPGLDTLFDLPAGMNLQGRPAMAVEREIARLQRTQPWIDTNRIRSPDQLKLATERIEFFNFDTPAEIIDHTGNMWYAVPGAYRLSLPEAHWLSVSSNLIDSWDIEHHAPGSDTTRVRRARTLADAIRAADAYVARTFPDAGLLVERATRWRDQPPTAKQLDILGRNGIRPPAGLTRGQAAHMIALLLATRRERRGIP
jgi:ATP-dependent helicase IRC3